MHVTLHVLDSRPLAGHEAEARAGVAARYAIDVKHEGSRLEALGGGLLAREVLGVVDGSQLVIGEHGKPSLAAGGPAFNLSNDEGLVVLGVLDEGEGPLGVDLNEVADTPLNRADLLVAKKYYREADLAAVGDGSTDAQRVAFARAWGALEAPLKAMGTGFDFDIRRHPEALDEWQITSMGLELPPASDGARRRFVTVVAGRERAELTLVLHDALAELGRLGPLDAAATPTPAEE